MTDNLITWNVRNWITVFLMFLAAWALLSLGVRFLRGGAANQQERISGDARENALLAAGVA